MDRTSLNISLPKALKEYIAEQVATGSFSTPSEFLRELIRADQKTRNQQRLENFLLEGLASGAAVELAPADWDRMRKQLRARHR